MLKYCLSILLVGASLAHFSCLQDAYSVTLSGPVTIDSEWIELRPETPLKADKDDQDVILVLAPPFKNIADSFDNEITNSRRSQGIVVIDGDVINPEIQVIDQYGNSFTLVYAGSGPVGRWSLSSGPKYSFPYPNELPRDREYTAVRIRSPKPIKCKAIYWFCDSVKDWK